MSNFAEKSRTRPSRSQDAPTSSMFVPMSRGCVLMSGEKRNVSPIYLRTSPRTLRSCIGVKAPIDSRVQLRDMRTKSSIPLSRYRYTKAPRRGQGAAFRFVAAKYSIFLAVSRQREALSVSRRRRDGEIWRVRTGKRVECEKWWIRMALPML